LGAIGIGVVEEESESGVKVWRGDRDVAARAAADAGPAKRRLPLPATVTVIASMQRVSTPLRLSARVVAGVRVRGVHSLRKLPYPVEGGLGAFLPPDALRTVGVEYQQGLLDRLNDYTRSECAVSAACVKRADGCASTRQAQEQQRRADCHRDCRVA
jgi:hypothetical protein